jgi:hypothetical protein
MGEERRFQGGGKPFLKNAAEVAIHSMVKRRDRGFEVFTVDGRVLCRPSTILMP